MSLSIILSFKDVGFGVFFPKYYHFQAPSGSLKGSCTNPSVKICRSPCVPLQELSAVNQSLFRLRQTPFLTWGNLASHRDQQCCITLYQMLLCLIWVQGTINRRPPFPGEFTRCIHGFNIPHAVRYSLVIKDVATLKASFLCKINFLE